MVESVNSNNNLYLIENETSATNSSIADPDTFLKILVAQLKYQNPLEPEDSSTFVNQLSQLATMEQMYNVSQSMDNLATGYETSRYLDLIGQQVQLSQEDDIVTGKVGGVVFYDGEPCFYLEGAQDGDTYTIDQVLSINTQTTNNYLPYLSLVGRQVALEDDDGEISGIVEKIIASNGDVSVQVDGQVYGVNLIKEICCASQDSEPEIPESTDNGDEI